MGSKTRLDSYCTKRANNGVNLVTSRNINTRLARPMNVILLFTFPFLKTLLRDVLIHLYLTDYEGVYSHMASVNGYIVTS